jgi:hypothetical protein
MCPLQPLLIIYMYDGSSRFRYSPSDTKVKRICSREESNLHGLPHTVLSRTRLPFRHVSDTRFDV